MLTLHGLFSFPGLLVITTSLPFKAVTGADATTYKLPAGPLAWYFYNPYSKVLMQVMLERLGESMQMVPCDIYVVTVTPLRRVLFNTEGSLTRLQESKKHFVHCATPRPFSSVIWRSQT